MAHILCFNLVNILCVLEIMCTLELLVVFNRYQFLNGIYSIAQILNIIYNFLFVFLRAMERGCSNIGRVLWASTVFYV